MKTIRVVLAEDHKLVRAGISSLLQNQAEIEVVAEASDGNEALALIQQHQPDVALLDIRMPGLTGLEVAERARKEAPQVRVIMLSMHAEEEYVLQAMRTGATGYLLKDASPDELIQAVQAVAHGQVYLSQAVSGHVTADYARQISGQGQVSAPGKESEPLETLTPRQREILGLIAKGHSTKEIARLLFLSPKTVDAHRAQLMERLGIYEVAGLVRYAIRNKLVSLDE